MTNIFEKASRTKVRFEHPRGNFTVEQLWELPLKSTVKVSLNELAVEVNKNITTEKTTDFVDGGTSTESLANSLKLDILKHIIGVKKNEIATRVAGEARRSQAQTIKDELAKRQMSSLLSGSDDELRKTLADLENS